MQADKALVLVVLFSAATACQRADPPTAVKLGAQVRDFTPNVFHNAFAATAAPVLRVPSGDSIHTTTIDAAGTDEKGVQRRPWCCSDHRRRTFGRTRITCVMSKNWRCAPCIDTLAIHPCPYGAPCLGDISVAEVGEALRAQLTSSRIARTSSDAAVHVC
jgi:hypothetical protein